MLNIAIRVTQYNVKLARNITIHVTNIHDCIWIKKRYFHDIYKVLKF